MDEATARNVVLDRLGSLGVPILSGLPIGHGQENLALVIGAKARIDQKTGRLLPDGPG